MRDALLSISFLKSYVITILLGLLIATGVAFASSKVSNELVLLAFPILFLVLYYIVFKNPEISFALFLTAGVYKADPRLSFLPDFLDLTVLFGLLAITGIIFKIVIKKIKFILPPKEVFMPFIIIAILGIFSLTYTIAPIYGTEKLLRFLTITSLAMFLPFFLFQDISSIRKFFTLYILLAVMMIVDVVSMGVAPGQFEFHSAFGSNYLAMARTTGVAVIVVLFYFLPNSKNKIMSLFYLFSLAILTFGTFLSGGRGPVIALFMSIFTIICYVLFGMGKDLLFLKLKKSFLKLFALIILPIIISVGLFTAYSDFFLTFSTRMEILLSEGGLDQPERIVRFEKAIDIVLSLPNGIIGVGVGGFSVYYASFDDKRGDYPHNIFLEIGSELGWIGLLAIIFLVYRSFSSSLLLLKTFILNKTHIAMTFFALLIYMIFNSSISGDVNDNRFLFTVIGLIFAYKNIAYQRDDIQADEDTCSPGVLGIQA